MKIKLFSVKENKNIEGENAELYCNLYIVFNKTYFFTFLIESPNLACSDRNLIRLIKHWIILVEEDDAKYSRRYEKVRNNMTINRAKEIEEKKYFKYTEEHRQLIDQLEELNIN